MSPINVSWSVAVQARDYTGSVMFAKSEPGCGTFGRPQPGPASNWRAFGHKNRKDGSADSPDLNPLVALGIPSRT